MALIGIGRAYQINLTPYLSEYGQMLYNKLQHASITDVLGQYPGLTWSQLAKAQYPTPETIPVYVHVANQLIMGSRRHTCGTAVHRPGRRRRTRRHPRQ